MASSGYLDCPPAPAEQRPTRPSKRQRRGNATCSRASRDLQQQVTFAHVPEIPTAIPILVQTDQELSTSGRAVIEEEKEEEGEKEERGEIDHCAIILSLAEQSALLAHSDSSGYSPSPDREMPRQPINLLNEFNLGVLPSRPPPSNVPSGPQLATMAVLSTRKKDKRPVESYDDVLPPLQRRRVGDLSTSRMVTDSPPLVQHGSNSGTP